MDMLIPLIPESGRECILKKNDENLKTGAHLNHTTLGLYTLGCFGTHTGILSQSNSNSLALAKYLNIYICADQKVLTNISLRRWQAKFETSNI